MGEVPNEDREVEDGFGGVWRACAKPWCDLQVVRPGKVQCNGRSRGGCGHDEEADEMEDSFKEGWDRP